MEAEYRTQIRKWFDKFPYWPKRPEPEVQEEHDYVGIGALVAEDIARIKLGDTNGREMR